ncbi:serine/threonine-protein kinase [Streptomyces niger]|uniref:serine/threonine-protein kinase n=1 Tax=Streptomyces niger TaxID=66373 RepID=UPI000A53DF22|nr:serine/threonine-protein kinase [Streptomyces niger]
MDAGTGNGRKLAGRYRLLAELGHGGMGVVWRARDELLHREVAVKEVRAPRELPAPEERLLYARLEREALAAARIAHRNVVTVFDVVTEDGHDGRDSHDGRPWIVMELIRGRSLAETLEATGPLPPRRVAAVGAEVLAALRVAHAAGVLHRDVKPGNVLLAHDGRVVLTDFGIATVEGSAALTLTGELIGSPEFTAPERALGRTPGPESDLWSLGVTLYAAVEGRSPFHRDTPLGTLRSVVDEELPPPRLAGPLAPVLTGLLRKDPKERLSAAGAGELLAAVAGGARQTTVTAAPPTPPYSPTIAAPGPPRGGEAGSGTGADGGGSGDGGGSAGGLRTPPPPGSYGPHPAPPLPPAPRRRRAVPALAAAALAVALAAGGAAWVLSHGDGHYGPDGPAASWSTGPDEQDAGRRTGQGAPDGSRERQGGGAHTSPPGTRIGVVVSTVRGSYTGRCPPPGYAAPAFSGAITVDRGPAEVAYRWRTETGTWDHARAWRTVRFPGRGAQRVTLGHTETARGPEGSRAGHVALEVKKGERTVTSHRAAFSVRCERGTPGGSTATGPPHEEPRPTDTGHESPPPDTGPSPTYGESSPSYSESPPSSDEGSPSGSSGGSSPPDGAVSPPSGEEPPSYGEGSPSYGEGPSSYGEGSGAGW